MKTIFSTLIFFIFINISFAQVWVQLDGTENLQVNTILSVDNDVYAGTYENGLYVSSGSIDDFEPYALDGMTINSILEYDGYMLYGTVNNGLIRNAIGSESFEYFTIDGLVVQDLSIDEYNESVIYACTYGNGPGGVYYSSDIGETWLQYSSSPPYAYLGLDLSESGRAFVGTPFGGYYSDNGLDWVQTTGPDFYEATRTVNYIGNDSVLYGSDFDIYLSTDNGETVEVVEEFTGGKTFVVNNNYFIDSHALFFAKQFGVNWIDLNFPYVVNDIKIVKGNIMIATNSGIFVHFGKPTGVEEKITKEFIVSPNPTSDFVKFDTKHLATFQIEIYNNLGQLILILENDNTVNVSKYHEGVYFYQLKSKDFSQNGSFVKCK